MRNADHETSERRNVGQVTVEDPEKERRNVGLVTADDLLKELFPLESSRPCVRWLREMQKKRVLPHRRVGRLVFFDVEECRQVIDQKFNVGAR
jgi:hypothetical protein